MKPRILLTGIFLLVSVVVATWLFWLNKTTDSYTYTPISEPPHPQIDSLFNLMNQALRSRNYPEGQQLAKTALKRSQDEKYCYGEVNSLTALGYVALHKSRYDSAAAFLEHARKLVPQYRLDPALIHRAGNFLADSYMRLGKTDEAERCLLEAVAYFQPRKDLLRLCSAYNELGRLYQTLGLYAKAQETFEIGLRHARKIEDDRYYERSFIGNLGILFEEMGKLDKAVPLIETSLKMGKEMQDPTAQSIDLLHLGNIHTIRGDFGRAIESYLKAARLAEAVGETREVLSAHKNIAMIYDALNDYPSAEYYYRQGMAIIDTQLKGRKGYFPWLAYFYGKHWMQRGDYPLAEVYLKRALQGFLNQNIPADVASCHLSLARLYNQMANYKKAMQYGNKALQKWQAIDASPQAQAEAYLELGKTYFATGLEDSARKLWESGLSQLQHYNDPNLVWQFHHQLGRYYSFTGENNSAVAHLREAIGGIEQLRRYTISPEMGSRFLSDKIAVYQRYFDLLYHQHRQNPTDELLNSLFALSEQTRSRALLEHLHAGMDNVFSHYTRSAELQNIESQMASLNHLIRNELLKPSPECRQALVEDWKEELAEMRQEYQRQSVQFAAVHPELSSLVGITPQVTLKEIQQKLATGQVILSYFISKEAVYGFAVSERKAVLRQFTITPKELNESVNRLLEPFRAYKSGQIDFLRLPFAGTLSHQLYQHILAPLLSQIGKADHFTIIPDGALHYLPFEMLVVEEKAASASGQNVAFEEFHRYRFWLEEATISYLPACSVLPVLTSLSSERAPNLLLAMGNPVSPAAVPSTDTVLAALSPPEGLRALALTPLPGASREIEGIRQIFGERGVLGLTGKQASETAYKQLAGQYRYLHFATHGYVNKANPNFSALLLHPGSAEDDGFLYVHEIFARPLQTELVSLSACETALGKLQAGEGLISFVQAFLAAGSRNVMASLWSVEESTYPLMVNFYRNIHTGMEIAEALRQAKLAFMKGHSQRAGGGAYAHTHPFLWAPFVVYGE